MKRCHVNRTFCLRAASGLGNIFTVRPQVQAPLYAGTGVDCVPLSKCQEMPSSHRDLETKLDLREKIILNTHNH